MRWMIAIVSLAATVLLGAQVQAQTPEDRAAVAAVADGWREHWNQHDAAAIGALLADDVDFTSVLGPAGRGVGREGFVQSHAGMFQTLFARSVWSNDTVTIDFLRPDVAIAHVFWSTIGDDMPGRPPGVPRRGKFLWVLEKQPQGWRIVAAQNTEAPPASHAQP